MPPPFAPTHSRVCPMVTREAAPEGVGAAGAETETLEANLSLPEAMAWFESVQSGRRFDRRRKKR